MEKDRINPGEGVLKVFGDMDDRFVREAAEAELKTKNSSRRTLWRVAAAAAAVALIACAALMLTKPGKDSGHTALNPTQAPETTAPEVTETPDITPVPDDTAAPVDVPGGDAGHGQTHNAGTLGTGYATYVVYGQQFYDLMEDIDDPSLVGEKVGEVTRLVDGSYYLDSLNHERVTTAIFAEHTGGMYGDIFAVRGYSTDYLLCQRTKSGEVRIYFNFLKCRCQYGRELLEDGLKLSENFASLQFLKESRWNIVEQTGTDFYEEIDPALYGDRIEAFLAALLDAEFRPASEAHVQVDGGGYRLEYEGTLRIVLRDGLYFNVSIDRTGHVWLNENLRGFLGYWNRMLFLDREAADGIVELIHGKFVETQVPAPATLADAAADPWLGAAVPKQAPEGMEEETVCIEKHSLKELRNDTVLEERGEDDPTKWITITFGAKYGGLPIAHIDIVPREDEGCLNEYGGVLSEYAAIESFSVSDFVHFTSDSDSDTVAAFVRVGEASVRITVTVRKGGIPEAEALIFSLLNSI